MEGSLNMKPTLLLRKKKRRGYKPTPQGKLKILRKVKLKISVRPPMPDVAIPVQSTFPMPIALPQLNPV